MTTGVVQFSTGLGSAEVARRAQDAYDTVVLLTADTLVEDEDNWRFAREAVAYLGDPEWVIVADGRTPMQVGRDERVVPNDRMAVCSKLLKRRMLGQYIDDRWPAGSVTILLGFDWTEEHRMDAARPLWHPHLVDAPLMRPPLVHKHQLIDQWRGYGIEPPRLYAAGFSHANCGGGCVRGGQAAWRRLLNWNRDRYLEWEGEEETSRAVLGKDVSILRDRTGGTTVPLTLRSFRLRLEAEPSLFDADDEGACGCL